VPGIDRMLIVCRECDALQSVPRPYVGHAIACRRCGARIKHSRCATLDGVLPLALAALLLFVLANTFPIVTIEVAGTRASSSLLGSVIELYAQGVIGVAGIVLLTGFVVPAAYLILLVYATVALAMRRRLHALAVVVRLVLGLRPWAMVEIFMLGILVSLVKLAGLARVIPDVGLWSLSGVMILMAAAHAAFDATHYWERIRALR